MAEPCYAPLFPATRRDQRPNSLQVLLRVMYYLLLIWLPGYRCKLKQYLFYVRYCEFGNAEKDVDLDFDPNDWLKAHPSVASDVIWLLHDTRWLPWASWNRTQRTALTDAYFKARIHALHGIPDAPPEAAPESFGADTSTFYPENLAWRIYVAHVGSSIAADQGRWVNWSLEALPSAGRKVMLDANEFYGLALPHDGEVRYVGEFQRCGMITLSDPTKVMRYLRQHDLIGNDRRDTIVRLLEWCRTNMIHFGRAMDDPPIGGALDFLHWQYTGDPPLIRILEGTTRSGGAFAHWTHGCAGTGAFLRAVLRLLNTPVELPRACDHTTVKFPTEGLFLSHGDDPYDELMRFVPQRPIDELLITESQFQSWFGFQLDAATVCNNVARQPRELTILHPTSYRILSNYSFDTSTGVDHEHGSVYGLFRNDHSLSELETGGLWTRLEAAFIARGGVLTPP